MDIDPTLVSLILLLISLFAALSKVSWLIKAAKILALLTLVYAVIFVPQIRDFFIAFFDTIRQALKTIGVPI